MSTVVPFEPRTTKKPQDGSSIGQTWRLIDLDPVLLDQQEPEAHAHPPGPDVLAELIELPK